MKKYGIRFLSLVLACTLAAALAGCADQKEPNAPQSNAAEGKLFEKPTELTAAIASSVSWPYNENWVMWKYLQEATGVTLHVQALPDTDLSTKLPLMMASQETLPDLLHVFDKKTVDDYALSGVFLSYDDHMDWMPNYKKFWSTLPEEERSELFFERTCGDGKIYSAPAYGTQTVNNLRTWMYRKDIFEKHGLKVPETTEELYQVAKKLKELYPDSYPICLRNGMVKIQEWGPSWQSGFFSNLYYDFDAGIWKWGIREPVMKEMAQYLIKLREEGILPPDYISMETKSWEELMSTDRGFITLDYIVRIDFFNLPNRLENPEYTLALMAPPKPDVPTGTQTLMKSNLNFAGYCVCNTGDEESQENAFRFVDWMYSDPAIELLSWGKENETYHIVDGKRKFILEGDEQPQNKYGIATYGLYQVLEVEANEATYTDEQVAACRQVLQYLEPQANPTMWMPFAEEEAQEAMDLKSALDSYTGEQLSQFLLGQKPMSEWDTFVKGLDDLHVDRLLEIYTQAYRRIVEK